MALQTRNIEGMTKKSKSHKVRQVKDNLYTVTSGSSGKEYKVRLSKDGASCTCDWGKRRWAKGGDGRSVCSHVIAVYGKRARSKGLQLGVFNSWRKAAAQHKRKLYAGDSVWITLAKKKGGAQR